MPPRKHDPKGGMSTLFDPSAKKKRKQSKRALRAVRALHLPSEDSVETPDTVDHPDYTYSDMLTRLYTRMSSHTSILNQAPAEKVKIPALQSYQVGVRKTVWINFTPFCNAVSRNTTHVSTFLENELGVDTSVDMDTRLVIKARFRPKELISVVKKYVEEYVICTVCGSKHSVLERERKIVFLKCLSTTCGARKSVTHLHKGYTHQLRRKRT